MPLGQSMCTKRKQSNKLVMKISQINLLFWDFLAIVFHLFIAFQQQFAKTRKQIALSFNEIVP